MLAFVVGVVGGLDSEGKQGREVFDVQNSIGDCVALSDKLLYRVQKLVS